MDEVEGDLMLLPDLEVIVDLEAVPIDARDEEADRASDLDSTNVVGGFVGRLLGV